MYLHFVQGPARLAILRDSLRDLVFSTLKTISRVSKQHRVLEVYVWWEELPALTCVADIRSLRDSPKGPAVGSFEHARARSPLRCSAALSSILRSLSSFEAKSDRRWTPRRNARCAAKALQVVRSLAAGCTCQSELGSHIFADKWWMVCRYRLEQASYVQDVQHEPCSVSVQSCERSERLRVVSVCFGGGSDK